MKLWGKNKLRHRWSYLTITKLEWPKTQHWTTIKTHKTKVHFLYNKYYFNSHLACSHLFTMEKDDYSKTVKSTQEQEPLSVVQCFYNIDRSDKLPWSGLKRTRFVFRKWGGCSSCILWDVWFEETTWCIVLPLTVRPQLSASLLLWSEAYGDGWYEVSSFEIILVILLFWWLLWVGCMSAGLHTPLLSIKHIYFL